MRHDAWKRPGAVLVLLGLFALTTGPLVGQRDFSKVEIEPVRVAEGIWMLQGAGGNIGVSVGEDGVLLVDDQFAPLAPKIRAALRELGGEGVAWVLNTHWHGDHTGGNPVFGREAQIIAHANVRERLSSRQEVLGRVVEPLPEEGLPDVTFDDGLSVHFNGEKVRVSHLAHAHTDGDSIVHFTGSKVVHLGDLFFSGRFPFVDLASGGSVEGLERHVGDLLDDLPEGVKIIPGHGPLSDLDDLRLYHRMLGESLKLVRRGMRQGLSLEEIQQRGMPERWKGWGDGFIDEARWIAIVHGSLQSGPRR